MYCMQRAPPVFNITAVATGAAQRWPAPPAPLPVQAQPRGHPARLGGDALLPPHMAAPDQAALRVEAQFRLLVPAAQMGGVIGRRGEVIQSIRDATGAHIRAHEGCSGAPAAPRPTSSSCASLPRPPGATLLAATPPVSSGTLSLSCFHARCSEHPLLCHVTREIHTDAQDVPFIAACTHPLCVAPWSRACAERKGADRVISVSSREAAGRPISAAQEALALIALCLLEPKGCPPVPIIRALVPTNQVTSCTPYAPPPHQIPLQALPSKWKRP